jgi:CheY-like chemotaxis protein
MSSGGPLSDDRVPRGDETILLVEDTDPLREVVREILEAQGYAVLPAARGEEALGLAANYQAPIHLLLTDLMLPSISGLDLARLVSALRPEIRVLYMSGYSEGAHQEGVLGDALLEKPFAPDALARAVRRALDGPVPRG